MSIKGDIVRYCVTEIGGIAMRPDSRAVMKAAVAGKTVEVSSGNDYINLYHVYERMQAGDKKLSKKRLVRKQIGHDLWHLFVVDEGEDAPDVELKEGYDPKRGRYKRYAEQLASGEAVELPTKTEAIKARRAWQLYVPAEKRRHLRSTVRRIGRSERYVVTITERS